MTIRAYQIVAVAAVALFFAVPKVVSAGECGRLCDENFWKNASKADVRAELDRGADPNALDAVYHENSLHYAALGSGDPSSLALLLDRGANIEARSRLDAKTPLHIAVEYNAEPLIAKLLLDRGANIEARTETRWTPLHLAVSSGTLRLVVDDIGVSIVTLLLNRGANVNAQDSRGESPLHKAVIFSDGKSQIVRLLLARGANPNLRDNNGKTPFEIIKGEKTLKDTKMYKLLRAAQ